MIRRDHAPFFSDGCIKMQESAAWMQKFIFNSSFLQLILSATTLPSARYNYDGKTDISFSSFV